MAGGRRAAAARDEEAMMREEQEALGRILHAFHSYGGEAAVEVARWERNFARLSPAHQALLPGHAGKCQAARQAILANQRFLAGLAGAFAEPGLAGGALAALKARVEKGVRCSPADADKARYVLKNAVRDWSAEGAAERQQSYGRICAELRQRLPPDAAAQPPRVLVPGCGLGRLPYELACAGYETMGNEFSYYMLLGSAFILNHSEAAEQWPIHPWLLASCNQLSDADQLREVRIPDVCISERPPRPGLLAMSAGDFTDVFARPEYRSSYDAVVTCFFLDCAHNVIEYIEIIHAILKEGGLWVNLGPLLYHWADAHTYLPSEELSIELPLAEVERIVRETGFQQLQRCFVPAAFNTNMRSMLQSSYRCVFWTMQKRAPPSPS